MAVVKVCFDFVTHMRMCKFSAYSCQLKVPLTVQGWFNVVQAPILFLPYTTIPAQSIPRCRLTGWWWWVVAWLIKGIPSYFFQHFFEIAKRTFIIKGKHLYCALMCKKFVTFHKSNKKIKFYSCTFQHTSRPFCVFYFRFTSNQVTI